MDKPFMPLMMGDWALGTMGMKLDVKGAYIDLLIYQYAHGYLPEAIDDLVRIVPDLLTVWVSVEPKFPVVAPGKRQNSKLESVRAFWSKQSKNGSKGGRPRKDKPDQNPKVNPNNNPKPNLHNDPDLDTDSGLNQKSVPAEFRDDVNLVRWEEWGNQIVQGLDFGWDNMHGRKVTREEMNVFLSVATRCKWELDSQQEFRVSLRGFDVKKGANQQLSAKRPVNMKNV